MDEFLEIFSANIAGRTRRKIVNGREYVILSAVSIVPGVLYGSDGPILYPEKDTEASTAAWNGMPAVVNHPYDPITGKPVSASYPGVLSRQQVGELRNSSHKGKLKHDVWVDLELAKKINRQVYTAIQNGEVVEVSTGLYLEKIAAPPGSTYKGKPYQWIATNYRPDHLAILPNQTGACSVKDGCGLNVNSHGRVDPETDVSDEELDPTDNKKKRKLKPYTQVVQSPPSGGTLDGDPMTANLTFNFEEQGNPLVDNIWTDQARQAAAMAKKAQASARDSEDRGLAGGVTGGASSQGGVGGSKGGGKAGAGGVGQHQQYSQAALQASTQAHSRGIASLQDLLHVEYAHAIAAYQFELAAMAHAANNDKAAYDAHKKAAEAHRKTAEALRKKIMEQESKMADPDDDDDEDDDEMDVKPDKSKVKPKPKDKKAPTKNEETTVVEISIPIENLCHSEIHTHLQRHIDAAAKLEGDNSYPYVDSVYDDHFIYRKNGKHYKQDYKSSTQKDGRGVVTLKHEPHEVERRVTYHPVNNQQSITWIEPKETSMPWTKEQKDTAIAGLTANCTCPKDKAALTATYNAMSEETLKALLAPLVANTKAQGSNADVKDDPATASEMRRRAVIEAGNADAPNTKSHSTQSNDNEIKRNSAGWKTMDEWFNDPTSAPPQVKQMIRNQMEKDQAEKNGLVARLIANIHGDAAKAAAKSVYEKMSIEDLRPIAAPLANRQFPPEFAHMGGMGGGSGYLGASVPLTNAGGSGQQEQDDILPYPTENAANDDVEPDIEKRTGGKIKRQRAV